MTSISHYKPIKYNRLIERVIIADAQDVDFNLMLIPSHYIMLYFPLSVDGYFYNGKHYNSPLLQKMVISPEYLKVPAGSKLLGVRFFPFGSYPFQTFEMNQKKEQLIEFDFDKKVGGDFDNAQINKGIAAAFKSLKKLYSPLKEQKVQLLKDFYYDLLDSNETTSVNTFCELKHISYMTMYRLFKETIGVPPKKLERIIKFRKSIDHIVHSKNRLTEIGIESGYYDQSHFIKEFNYFVRMSPSDYIAHLKKENLYGYKEFTKLSSL